MKTVWTGVVILLNVAACGPEWYAAAVPVPATDALNVCLPKHGPRFEGSLGKLVTQQFILGTRKLKQIQRLPQDLVIRWSKPVTFCTNVIKWESDEVYGVHYGLEYWDIEERQYRLVYEESDNSRQTSIHRFKSVVTTHVRFTVFEHPLGYNAVTLTGFSLY